MKVSQLMRKGFVSLEPGDSLLDAARALAEKGLREAPVVQRGKLVGMFSTSDLAAALVKKSLTGRATVADASRLKGGSVEEHMNRRPGWIDEEADIASAIAFLIHRNADCIPVLDKKRNITGVLMGQDLRKEMVKILAAGGQAAKLGGVRHAEALQGGTAIDQILHYVQERGSTTAEEIARQFRLPVAEVEEYAVSLEKHGLLKLEYSIFGKMKVRKAE